MAFQYRVRSNEAWEKRANQSSSDFDSWLKDDYRNFTPSKGENHIRIMPPSWEDAEHYAIEAWVHYGIGPERGSVLCLFKMKGQPCPICEERARAERARDEELTRELRATKRSVVFLLNRKDEAQGVLVWGMPFTVDREIIKASKDRSTGTYNWVDHPTEGYDVYFDKEGEGLTTKYTGVSLAKRPSAIPEKIATWVEKNPLPEVLRWRTYDEVKRLYEGAGRGERAEDRDRDRDERPSRGGNGFAQRDAARDNGGRRRDEDEEAPRAATRGNGRRDPDEGTRQTTAEQLDDHIPEHPAQSEMQAQPETLPEREPETARPSLQRPGSADGKSRAADLRSRFMSR